MRCPFCHHSELKVTDSRNVEESNSVRRRRECLSCGQRFNTFETIDLSLQVLKRDKRYQDFDQNKLISGLEAACRHTKISRDQVKQLAADISAELMRRQVRVIDSVDLGEMVMRKLERLDRVAFIRFASVYRRFQEIDEVMEAIHAIKPDKEEGEN